MSTPASAGPERRVPVSASRSWTDLAATEVAAAVARDPVLVLPTAAVEQHGPHLPLSTDADIGRGLLGEALARVADGVTVYTLPMQSVGASAEHGRAPGTLDLGAAPFEEAVVAVGRSVASAGVRRLVVHNSHGGNKATLDRAALRLRRECGLLVVKAHWFRFPRPDVGLPEGEWVHGLHGGAVETAMMLHLVPERVRTDRCVRFPSLGEDLEGRLTHLGPEGAASFAWLAQDLNPEGVVGDAGLATPELGRRLVEHYAAVLARVIEDAAA
ncbi:MAG: creatininase family protein, partial [Gemmatimonadetes bacterium]|nr:creatininase family protein [Gemmatimonadota bacterium]